MEIFTSTETTVGSLCTPLFPNLMTEQSVTEFFIVQGLRLRMKTKNFKNKELNGKRSSSKKFDT